MLPGASFGSISEVLSIHNFGMVEATGSKSMVSGLPSMATEFHKNLLIR
jgi:hypothetical protein